MSQHITTRRSGVAKHTQHAAPHYVAIFCVEMLRSFGRALLEQLFTVYLFQVTDTHLFGLPNLNCVVAACELVF